MSSAHRGHPSIWNVLSFTSLLCGVVFLLGSAACKHTPDGTNSIVPSPRDNAVTFVKQCCVDCTNQLKVLELDIEPTGGAQDTVIAREAWRRARHQYEMMRWATAQFDPYNHRVAASWHSTNPLSGFHYMEKIMFVNNPKMSAHETDVETIYFCTNTYFPQAMDVSGRVTDDGIFHGLQYMLADIDSLKLSGLDTSYANNSVADALSNLEGLDTVYAYYKADVAKTDSLAGNELVSRVNDARAVLTTAGTLSNLDKTLFRNNYLKPLQAALKNVAAALNIVLP